VAELIVDVNMTGVSVLTDPETWIQFEWAGDLNDLAVYVLNVIRERKVSTVYVDKTGVGLAFFQQLRSLVPDGVELTGDRWTDRHRDQVVQVDQLFELEPGVIAMQCRAGASTLRMLLGIDRRVLRRLASAS
jgi:hypothetical protein